MTMAPETPPHKTLAVRPPLNRDVARPVANLGNTCYMNAVLQALAHAPELCTAMDVEPHYLTCPIYLQNDQKRQSSSPTSSPGGLSDPPQAQAATRKSRRSGGKKSPTNSEEDCKFCVLCEVEQHMARVHSASSSTKPVAPSTFVGGFIEHVAPWFKLGVQEDSHEFLRLLIDAMQRSCKLARVQENPQDTPPEDSPEEGDEPKDKEYPFQLFRGTVESNVTCESCKSTSCTLDPIEDIGLEVTNSSANASPPTTLADVGSAFQRFSRPEALDSGYKCEKCGKVGRATKQSRLASIPPILTLHLKRFRYGGTVKSEQPARRSARSEVSQLTDLGGKSGSAKIEGHTKFEQIFDLKPYLTKELQAKHSNMFCRLFAVIVHAGKNSHSGHYISYVRNVSKNEWWKMDDARVTQASVQEVMNAEAYMLFYRVVEHPFAMHLRTQAKLLQTRQEEIPKIAIQKEEPKVESDEAAFIKPKQTTSKPESRKRKAPDYANGEDWARAKTNLPEHLISKFKDVEQIVSEFVQFKPEFFKLIADQASKTSAKVGHGPSSGVCGMSIQMDAAILLGALFLLTQSHIFSFLIFSLASKEDDVVDRADSIRRALIELFYELNKSQEKDGKSLLKTRSASLRDKESLAVLTSMASPDVDTLL
jgi:ubiquitin C-terminal hydrolase